MTCMFRNNGTIQRRGMGSHACMHDPMAHLAAQRRHDDGSACIYASCTSPLAKGRSRRDRRDGPIESNTLPSYHRGRLRQGLGLGVGKRDLGHDGCQLPPAAVFDERSGMTVVILDASTGWEANAGETEAFRTILCCMQRAAMFERWGAKNGDAGQSGKDEEAFQKKL